ncbi:pleckstrin homology domain-containing family H member 1 isoform X1 [Ictalurus punctatus]|uniref:Pleckstrin homology domain-containing family H member 1 isoform X1 n=1 Tax=Ictalurus punctatus TaxID=7998 RepID=A0A2D0RPK5_ICTPU|nr:pleckstrin homology domain-containing family H member 1 isoform X1 [Ictalurus punctatus]XP_017332439.2 pleckstrin homology domain-containing family H member 1 isoform X1 [Ictalurus punctatus]XP_047013589.2 pleckstrin homology domain-containing family H member 1 isoform X1 [Ictalurus punctatus]
MAEVMDGNAAAAAVVVPSASIDWQKRCIALEMQLLRFRLQAGKIRQLLAEKMQELEQRVTEADQRAENAEKQVQIMEEKLKSVNMHPSESESSLYRRYQELTGQMQEKDMVVKKLEAQLEKQNFVRAQEAKIIEEKAAKIKDWVTFKLREMEMENQQLKMTNLKQAEQILLLQDKLQTVLERPTSPCSPKPLVVDVQLVSSSPLHTPSYFGVSPTQDERLRLIGSCKPGSNTVRDGKRKAPEASDSQNASEHLTRHKFSTDKGVTATGTKVKDRREGMEPSSVIARERGGGGASDRDHSSDELNSKFRLQCLRSSSSSSSSSSSAYDTSGPRSFDTPTPTPKSPPPVGVSLAQINPAPLVLPSGTSMTLPKVRTPLTPRDSIQLLKKHHSQPQPGLERLHHVNVTIDIGSATSPYRHSLALGSASTLGVEETDIDEGPLESMDGVVEGSAEEVAPYDGVSFVGLAEELEMLDPEALKPPTPPLHRFPSWESRIYAVAKSGMRVSEASPGARNMGRVSTFPQYPAAGPFTHLIYKNISIPVYSTLKGKATQISSAPLPDEDSGSEDDSSSLASLRTSTVGTEKKGSTPGSPRAVKRGVSMSSISSESDYAIPPDAYSLDSDYSEPEQKVQRTSSYSCESVGPETLEKSGYLLKMGSQVKAWKRRWFILRNGEILYYKSPVSTWSDVIRKPQGQIELNSSCRIARGEGAQTFQLITEKKTFYLTADSPNILEEWIRVLQNILKVQASGPFSTETQAKPTVRGWLTKVKHGHSKLVWCTLIGKIFYYYRNQDDKFPLGQLYVREARVEEVDRSCDSDEDYEAGGRGFLSSHCTLVVHPKEQSPTYLLIGTKQEKDTWLYHLTVAAGNCASLKVATEYEQLIGKLLDVDGDPDSLLWKHEVLCFSKEGLRSPLTTLPSEALQTEALKLFKSCQLFINVLVEAPSIDYHTSLAQSALQVCLTHPELQNEMYCQLIKQTNRRMPNNYSLTQCWQLLSVCVALFLPQHHFLWYLRQYLQRHADPKSEVGKYAVYCQRSVERVLQNGEREAKPSRMEIVSILLRNPYHHSLPFSIPVHFMNSTYQVVGFDGSTTVEEFVNTLNQRAGMRKPQLSGFALFTDDPSGKDLEHCLQPATKICDVISKWEQALKELQPGKCEGTRIVRLTYKSRLCFRAQAKGETERERLLLAYQVNEEVHQGHFPVNKELALEVAALMAQVEHGDLDRAPASPGGSPQTKIQQILLQVLERFYPKRYKQDCNIEQLRELAERLATKWSVLQGCTAAECVRIYLTVARKWPLFGSKLFSAKPLPPSALEHTQVWLAVSEDGLSVLDYSMHLLVTYPFQSVITFGGCKEDFMVVVSQIKDQALGKKTVDKLIFAMAKPKILELTLLMASYINWTSDFSATGSQAQSSTLGSRDRKLRDIDSSHFPSMTYTTKGPTLL